MKFILGDCLAYGFLVRFYVFLQFMNSYYWSLYPTGIMSNLFNSSVFLLFSWLLLPYTTVWLPTHLYDAQVISSVLLL